MLLAKMREDGQSDFFRASSGSLLRSARTVEPPAKASRIACDQGPRLHIVADANGTLASVILTDANRNDIAQMLLVRRHPPNGGAYMAGSLKPILLCDDRGQTRDASLAASRPRRQTCSYLGVTLCTVARLDNSTELSDRLT